MNNFNRIEIGKFAEVVHGLGKSLVSLQKLPFGQGIVISAQCRGFWYDNESGNTYEPSAILQVLLHQTENKYQHPATAVWVRRLDGKRLWKNLDADNWTKLEVTRDSNSWNEITTSWLRRQMEAIVKETVTNAINDGKQPVANDVHFYAHMGFSSTSLLQFVNVTTTEYCEKITALAA